MPRLQKIVTPVVVMFLILACGMKNTGRSRVVEEATVYSALINEQLEVPFSYLMGDPIIIVNSTVYDTVNDDYLYDSTPSLYKNTIEDFKEVNKESQTLDVSLSLNKPYEYITLPIDENGWIELEQKYPNAISITSLSKIGFNKELDQALVFMSYYCGNKCGLGNIYFLVRKEGTWKIENTIGVWIS